MGLPARFQNRLPAQKRGLSSMVTAGLGAGSPPRIALASDGFVLIDAGGAEKTVETKYLDCVIFDANYEVPIQRTFWGDPDDPAKAFNPNIEGRGPPVCYSDNGIGASAQASEPQSTNCQTCRWNKFDWVSKADAAKKTKACQTTKKLAVLPLSGEVDNEGTYVPDHMQQFPFVLRVPIKSHDNLRVYGLKFQPDDVVFDMHEVVTRLSFEPGNAYKVLQFEAVGFTDERTAATIERFLAEHHTDALVGRGDVPWQGVQDAALQQAQVAHQESQRQLPTQQTAQAGNGAGEAPKRSPGRPKKQQPEPTQTQPPAGEGVPAFLRRTAQPASAPQGQAASPFGSPGGTGTSHGIVQAQGPTSEMAAALDKVFGLKT